MALPVNSSTHLIPAYYSFINPERMKGWVGLVGWPVADGLLTLVVTHQLQVERRTKSSPVKDRRSTTEPRHQPRQNRTEWLSGVISSNISCRCCWCDQVMVIVCEESLYSMLISFFLVPMIQLFVTGPRLMPPVWKSIMDISALSMLW